MMSTEHAHWLERGDIYALGALDGEELKDFQAHLAMDCAMCAAYLRETRETLNLLHRSLRPITPRSELKARLLEKVRSEKVVPIAALQPKASQCWQRITGMISAGIVAVVVVGAFYQYRNRAVINTAVVNLLRDPSTRDLPLYGAGANAASQGDFSGTIPARVISSSPIYRRRREEKPTRCGRLRATPRRATSAHSTPTRTDKAVGTSNQLPAQRPLKPLRSRWKKQARPPLLPGR